MRRLLCAVPILATPFLFSCLAGDRPEIPSTIKPLLDPAVSAQPETATFALG
jgi:hypothetical protein